jgi:hypothetical protein
MEHYKMTPHITTVQAQKCDKIGAHRVTLFYHQPLKKHFSIGSLAINEVVLGMWVNRGRCSRSPSPRSASRRSRHPVGYGDPQYKEVKGHGQQLCGPKEAHHE